MVCLAPSRGPNKYTRTWEDEDAYRRQAGAAPPPRKPPSMDDFPDLDPAKRQAYVLTYISIYFNTQDGSIVCFNFTINPVVVCLHFFYY